MATISISSGTLAVFATSANEMSKIDSRLNLAAQTTSLSSDPLSAALVQIDTLGPTTEVGFYSINRDYSSLGDVDVFLAQPPTLRQLKLAAKNPISIARGDGDGFRLRTSRMPDAEFVVFATSLAEVSDAKSQNMTLLGVLTGSAVALSVLALWLITRKDLKRIETLIAKAQQISLGDFATGLDTVASRSELDLLNNSLSTMVETLKSAVEKERQAQRSMQDFIADASHELKTPLTLIKGHFELISKNSNLEPEVLLRSQGRISDQIERMQRLIDDLLLLAELQQVPDVVMECVPFSDVVEDAISDLKTLHPARKVMSNVEPDVTIKGSKPLLVQLLANLISNLSRYVSDECEVSFELITDYENAILKLDDSGVGLPDSAYLEGIQSFTRFDNSRSRDSGGSGLGISIMSAIVAQHGGHLTLSRSELGGLCTTVVLPLATQNSQSIHP